MRTEAGPNAVPRTVPSCGFALIAFASVLRFALTGPVALYLVFLFCFLFFLAAACECALCFFFSAGAFEFLFSVLHGQYFQRTTQSTGDMN
jgi:hypothetical protein